MPHASSPRAALVRAAVSAIALLDGPPQGPVVVTVSCNGTRIEETVTAEEVRQILGPPERPPLTELESDLIAVLTEAESKPAAIARRAGKNCTAHVYAALHSLVNKGYALRGGRGGYLRA